ncbi:SDR family oxidoreductase [Rhizobiaceae bacterium BDR2-2]|uniref:3-dehydrosphinganine reductase n=1 Tax=Ectorhizobium quercum TaxID=2965071 RepID=A0AAE3MXQ9_9HYPH|nr:SDR family oxidoreductase [Ectorhizobium quercum]MCX8996211.1 SDR family oxidoreductase [Ectorhizobium quercum]MCX8998750.1 SDR family oxidoreductase [Ectorhizobium quercum]
MTHAIITGGSSGIGLEIARLYLARGYAVTLLARRTGLLEAARRDLAAASPENAARIHVVSADVADEASVAAALAGAEAALGPCDILVTAAGRVDPGFFDEQPPGLFEEQVRVNFLGTVHAARAVLAGMKARGRGRIMLVSSAAAHIGIPAYAAYCASKSALKGFAEALRAEARPFGVSVCICYPPDTRTPQYEQEIRLRPAAAQAVMGGLRPWKAGIVARRIVTGLDRGRAEVHFGFALTMLALFGAFIKPVIYRRTAHGRRP